MINRGNDRQDLFAVHRTAESFEDALFEAGERELRRYWSDLAGRREGDPRLREQLRKELCRGWLIGARGDESLVGREAASGSSVFGEPQHRALAENRKMKSRTPFAAIFEEGLALFQVRLDMLFITARTDAMAELGSGLVGDVSFN